MFQALIVGLIVVACAGYSVWALLPTVARRALAGWMLELPVPTRLVPWLRRSATTSSAGCGACGSCESTSKAGATRHNGTQPIVFHPRRH